MVNSVLSYLEATTDRYPKKTAVIDEYGSCSWEELRESSRRIGSALGKLTGIAEPVPVFMEKGIAALQAFLGSVYAGSFYVLINPQLPAGRQLQIMDVLQAKLVITDEAHAAIVRTLLAEGGMSWETQPKLLLIEDLLKAELDERLLAQRRAEHIDTDPLYANFTSGSTGTPKGVLVGHRSVIDFIDYFTELFGIDETDVIANQAPFDFDVSVKDIYPALKTGATLLLVPRQLFSNPTALLDFLCENNVTNLTWAVSALCLVSTFHGLDFKVPKRIRRILFSGEVMPQKHLHYWMEKLPEAEFVNLYGPTEITCNCTYHRIDRQRDYNEGIPIGRSFPNERVFLLDADDRQITDPGQIGEICVTGSALALGYYRAKEQTQTAFCSNPLVTGYPERIYRTGDLGRFDGDGELLFSGRKDFQIKYMGHRIELEEIERAMEAIPQIHRCCCIFDSEKERLYGFYIGEIDRAALHEILTIKLPDYMVPGRLVRVDEMPLTKNGKIDRKRLLAEAASRKRRIRQ